MLRVFSREVLAAEQTTKIVVLGDTLIENKGTAAVDRFPEQLELALRAKGRSVAVVNAGLVTDTAARALRRLDRVITDETDAVILDGGNDMLWGISPDGVREALGAIIQNLRARGIAVLLLRPFELNPNSATITKMPSLPCSPV